jgi:hypothetical protein
MSVRTHDQYIHSWHMCDARCCIFFCSPRGRLNLLKLRNMMVPLIILLNDEWIGITGGITDRKKNRRTQRRPVPVPLYPLQISHGRPRKRIECSEKSTDKPLSYGVALCSLLSLVCAMLSPPHDASWRCGWRRPADMEGSCGTGRPTMSAPPGEKLWWG